MHPRSRGPMAQTPHPQSWRSRQRARQLMRRRSRATPRPPVRPYRGGLKMPLREGVMKRLMKRLKRDVTRCLVTRCPKRRLKRRLKRTSAHSVDPPISSQRAIAGPRVRNQWKEVGRRCQPLNPHDRRRQRQSRHFRIDETPPKLPLLLNFFFLSEIHLDPGDPTESRSFGAQPGGRQHRNISGPYFNPSRISERKVKMSRGRGTEIFSRDA